MASYSFINSEIFGGRSHGVDNVENSPLQFLTIHRPFIHFHVQRISTSVDLFNRKTIFLFITEKGVKGAESPIIQGGDGQPPVLIYSFTRPLLMALATPLPSSIGGSMGLREGRLTTFHLVRNPDGMDDGFPTLSSFTWGWASVI